MLLLSEMQPLPSEMQPSEPEGNILPSEPTACFSDPRESDGRAVRKHIRYDDNSGNSFSQALRPGIPYSRQIHEQMSSPSW